MIRSVLFPLLALLLTLVSGSAQAQQQDKILLSATNCEIGRAHV